MPTAKRGRPRTFDRKVALVRALEVFWRHGFEPATIAVLCSAIGIKPPSLYAAFGNKAQLFMEAVLYYEDVYWGEAWRFLEEEPDVRHAVAGFFERSIDVLLSQEAPCGCMVILGATNVSPESQKVNEDLRALRLEGKQCFRDRLSKGVEDEQLSADAPVQALASTLNAILEGMSIEARDGGTRDELMRIAAAATSLLPDRRPSHS